ncbi:hypothetical protein [uncultured Phocaeicola sp.]|jgi:hypothetical protein|uniref:hypothetical protein n=1 Tax=uncultured Phocaeicola sp. TaxID=990718 RepID=UPI0025AEC65B|nr:hypothetical protein [uncultured Phocaeicola sp.]
MLEEMVKAVVNKVIAQDYAFLKTPAALYAVVTKATQLGETFEYKDLVIHNDETGTSYRGHITAHWYEYTLQVVDRWGNVDEAFPVFPDIRSRIQLKTGAFVSVAMAYGDAPAIIREVKL